MAAGKVAGSYGSLIGIGYCSWWSNFEWLVIGKQERKYEIQLQFLI
jgi:hypothetical protein